jgi:hypothetical protein
MWLNGAALTGTDANGTPLTDDTFLILFNSLMESAAVHAAAGQPGIRMGTGIGHHPGHGISSRGRTRVVCRHGIQPWSHEPACPAAITVRPPVSALCDGGE